MGNNTVKIKLHAPVTKSFYNKDEKKLSLRLGITADIAEWITDLLLKAEMDWTGENYPIKDESDGSLSFKVSTCFMPQVKGITEDDFPYIGPGSDVTAYVQMKAKRYARKNYVSAYLVGIEVHEFVEYNPEDVFETNDWIDANAAFSELTNETANNE